MRACVLPTQAGPLAGDHDRVRIVVGAEAMLVVRPVSATVALPGAPVTRLDLVVEVGRGGRLVLEDAPLIVASGADVVRSMMLKLAAGAEVALRDTVVLGRTGEAGGRLVSTLRVSDDDGVVLHDALRIEPGAHDAYVALAPGHRAVATICLLGMRLLPSPAAIELEGLGALLRATGASVAGVDPAAEETWRRWRSAAQSINH